MCYPLEIKTIIIIVFIWCSGRFSKTETQGDIGSLLNFQFDRSDIYRLNDFAIEVTGQVSSFKIVLMAFPGSLSFKLCYQPGSHTVTGQSSISKWHGPIAIFAERHCRLVR